MKKNQPMCQRLVSFNEGNWQFITQIKFENHVAQIKSNNERPYID